jgi:hypothetical protein
MVLSYYYTIINVLFGMLSLMNSLLCNCSSALPEVAIYKNLSL